MSPLRLGLVLLGGSLLGCATRSPVRTERPLDRQEVEPPVEHLELSAELDASGETVQVAAVRRLRHDRYVFVEVRNGQRYAWEDARGPALTWGLVSVGMAGVGLGVHFGEGHRLVERARVESGTTAASPDSKYEAVAPKSRVGSTTTWALAGGLGLVAVGQLASPVLPASDRQLRVDRRFSETRWEEHPAGERPVSIHMGDALVGTGTTDAEGQVRMDLRPPTQVDRWVWQLTVTTGADHVTVDGRDSRALGRAAGSQAAMWVGAGRLDPALEMLGVLARDHGAHGPAWAGYCGSLGASIGAAQTVTALREILPGSAPEDACQVAFSARSDHAFAQAKRALRAQDLGAAEEWAELVHGPDRESVRAAIADARARVRAAEEAAERREARRLRASWAGRTQRGLYTCKKVQTEIASHKRAINSLARAGSVGPAQDRVERFQAWFDSSGGPRLQGAIEDLQGIHDEMREQDVAEEVERAWLLAMKDACRERY